VGSHPDGDSPLGIHDLAGNVAEWVVTTRAGHVADPDDDAARGIAKGGSWASALAAELRIWAKVELDAQSRDGRIGVRCAYPP